MEYRERLTVLLSRRLEDRSRPLRIANYLLDEIFDWTRGYVRHSSTLRGSVTFRSWIQCVRAVSVRQRQPMERRCSGIIAI